MTSADQDTWNGKLRSGIKNERKSADPILSAGPRNVPKISKISKKKENIQSTLLEWCRLKNEIKKNDVDTKSVNHLPTTENKSSISVVSNTREYSLGSNKEAENRKANLLEWCQLKNETTNDRLESISKFDENSFGSNSLIPSINNLEYCISTSWRKKLENEFSKPYFKNIKCHLNNCPNFFPPLEKIFTFTNYFNISDVKVVIIGQDPYHNDGQAMGLSFSVPLNVRLPPSLQNIYKEIKDDVGVTKDSNNGDLTPWAQQGVLLLNDVLTVTKNKPRSHADIGWEKFTDKILDVINKSCIHVVFMLWGRHAQAKASFIDKQKHLILVSAHPSPYSVQRFFGCKHFSKANDYLKKYGKVPINW